jgi:hypothetical protein
MGTFPIQTVLCPWRVDAMTKRFLFGLILALGYGLLDYGVLWAESPLTAYFPLAVGNRWVYESSNGPDGRSVVESWEVLRQEGSSFVMQITLDNEKMISFQMSFVPTVTETGRFDPQAEDQETEETEPRSVLRAPLTVGARWQNEDGDYEVTAIDRTITVPAGTFTDCVVRRPFPYFPGTAVINEGLDGQLLASRVQ